MIGRTIGHYRITSTIAEGGMGVVYKAADTHLDRPVAVKVLRPEVMADPDRRRRLQQEARATSALNHPNIVHVYDVASADGVDFIAMEYVEGPTLAALIEANGLSLATALDYAIQVADALAAAHARGIVHRDLKPANILVNARGQAKVLDFGIAKLVDPFENDSETTRAAQPRTEPGVIVGTAAYMSPEQAEGRAVSAQSDIFSFGSTLFEMVTGRRAFAGGTYAATVTAILHTEPPPLRAISRNAPVELEKIIERCLRKDPARRAKSIADVRLVLQELIDETSSGHATRRAANQWNWWRLTAAVAAAAAAVGTPWLIWRAASAEDPLVPLRAAALTTLPGIEAFPSLSPDGRSVAFMWTGPGQDNADIYVQLIGAEGSPMRLTSSARTEFNPVWSPDGNTIAFIRTDQAPFEPVRLGKAEVWLIPALGGTERKLTDVTIKGNRQHAYLSWCPDSACIVASHAPGTEQADALFLFARDSAERKQLTYPAPSFAGDSNPAISPDGRWLAFSRGTAISDSAIFAVQLDRSFSPVGELIRVTPAEYSATFPAWLPNSDEVVFSGPGGGNLWRVSVPPTGTPARLPYVGDSGRMPTVARTGSGGSLRLIYVRSAADINVWRVDVAKPGDKGNISSIARMSSTTADFLGDLSSDGKRVAFVSNRSGIRQVWLSDIDGSNPIQLTSEKTERSIVGPRWSPDGSLIAFHAVANGQIEIYTIPTTGGRLKAMASDQANDYLANFSRDGRWIYFSSTRTGSHEIWRVPVTGGEPTRVTNAGGALSFESRDGRDLYYNLEPNGTTVFRQALQGDPQRVPVLDGVIDSFFVVDAGIYFVDRASENRRLRFLDFMRDTPVTVADNLGQVIGLLTASRDGRVVLFSRLDSSTHDLMLVDGFR